jgi:hypothetical protein
MALEATVAPRLVVEAIRGTVRTLGERPCVHRWASPGIRPGREEVRDAIVAEHRTRRERGHAPVRPFGPSGRADHPGPHSASAA